jgi:hypothetical protein
MCSVDDHFFRDFVVCCYFSDLDWIQVVIIDFRVAVEDKPRQPSGQRGFSMKSAAA